MSAVSALERFPQNFYHTFTLRQVELKDLLYRTVFVAAEASIIQFRGVHLEIIDGRAQFTACDGCHLARAYRWVKIDPSVKASYTLSLEAAQSILKVLSDKGDVVVKLKKDKISFEVNDTRLIPKLLSRDYPDISKAIPESSKAVISLHRERLITLIEKVAESASTVQLLFAGETLLVTAGKNKEIMPANYQWVVLETSLNPRYILSILRHCKEETINFGITGGSQPVVITENEEHPQSTIPNVLFVQMPRYCINA